METTVREDIRAFFDRYQKLGNAKDYKEQAKMHGKYMLALGPKGMMGHKNTAISRFMFALTMSSHAKKIEMTSLRIMSLQEQAITPFCSLVKVGWGTTFKKTGEQLIEFDISYLVRRGPEGLEIVFYVTHEDEMEALKRYGLLE